MTAATLIKKAQKIQDKAQGFSEEAVATYKDAIAACKSDADEYELLFANYQLLCLYSDDDIPEARVYGERCLQLLAPVIRSGAIMHYTEMGQFQQEVICQSTNIIAWDTYSNTNDEAKLEEALQVVETGCAYADDPERFYILDTKVRILLRLNRKQEAYHIVRSCFIKDKATDYFDDIKQDTDYLHWKKELEAGIVTSFTEQEKLLLQKAADITENIQSQLEIDATPTDFTKAMPEKKVIGFAEAKAIYGIHNYHEQDSFMMLIQGDVYVDGDLNDAWFNAQLEGLDWKGTLYGTIIEGNLFINGSLLDDNYLELLVTGNLDCKYVYSRDGVIRIRGNANIKYGTYGEYNDGSFDVDGALTSPYLIAYDHAMPRQSQGAFIHIEGGKGTDRETLAIGESTGSGWGWGWNYYEDSQKLLSPEVWDEQDLFSIDHFFEIVKKGGNPFIKLG